MNLVCFSNNTAGGLVCDLLNNSTSEFDGYKTTGSAHNAFKISDTSTVQWSVDVEQWRKLVERFKNSDMWMGTHLHPSGIPDIKVFDKVLAITTETRESKLYRWLRYYHGWWCKANPQWQESDNLSAKDQIRELAKNVFVEFTAYPGCWNVEFSDIVNGRFIKENSLNQHYFYNWKSSNSFLNYTSDSWAYLRFYEAEWELINGSPYHYT